MHLRKNAWWAWAPRHDPADDHIYDWLRLDNELQKQLSSSLASLEVPPTLAEEEPPEVVAVSFAPPYAKSGKKASDDLNEVGVVAAIRQPPSTDLDRHLFKPRSISVSATSRISLADWRKQQDAASDGPAAVRDASFRSDLLCVQSSAQCATCGATRTYAPKGKVLPPFCDYASEVTHECRRGVGAEACGNVQALGGTISERRLCAPLTELTAEQRKSNPFIRFAPATQDAGPAVVAMVAPLLSPSPRLTLIDVVLHMQRQCRRGTIRRHRAVCAVQQCFRVRHARRTAAATVCQTEYGVVTGVV